MRGTNGQPVPNGSVSGLADSEEEILVSRARRGDMIACGSLMGRYNQRLHRAIRAVLKTGSDVEDAMQDTYLAALRSLDQFEGRADFGSWFLKIGTNAALARMRQRMRVVRLDDLPDLDGLAPRLDLAREVSHTPEQHVSNQEIAAIVEEAIDQLPDDYRQVLMLRTIEGLDTTETAEALGLGADAVRQRLHRARERLQAAIQDQADGANDLAFGSFAADGTTSSPVRVGNC